MLVVDVLVFVVVVVLGLLFLTKQSGQSAMLCAALQAILCIDSELHVVQQGLFCCSQWLHQVINAF